MPTIYEQITTLLNKHGPMRPADVDVTLGFKKGKAATALWEMWKTNRAYKIKTKGKVVYQLHEPNPAMNIPWRPKGEKINYDLEDRKILTHLHNKGGFNSVLNIARDLVMDTVFCKERCRALVVMDWVLIYENAMGTTYCISKEGFDYLQTKPTKPPSVVAAPVEEEFAPVANTAIDSVVALVDENNHLRTEIKRMRDICNELLGESHEQ